jgi:lipoic acid synthetase
LETGNGKAKGKPGWLKKKISLNNKNILKVKNLLADLNLHTVCQSAKCPNIFECFSSSTATFMLMGDICTRNCAFCGVSSGKPLQLDLSEPEKIALAAKDMSLKYIVLTSVTRDDLSDGGAGQFINTILEIKKILPGSIIECLIPDFNGNKDSIAALLEVEFEVLNHNIETIKKNYGAIRNKADYDLSLDVLKYAKRNKPAIITKSGFMLGLGEKRKEIISLLEDLKAAEVDIITIGQYLQPSQDNVAVQKYYTPDEFEELRDIALNIGFQYAVSGSFVRSSYQASTAFQNAIR